MEKAKLIDICNTDNLCVVKHYWTENIKGEPIQYDQEILFVAPRKLCEEYLHKFNAANFYQSFDGPAYYGDLVIESLNVPTEEELEKGPEYWSLWYRECNSKKVPTPSFERYQPRDH